MQPQPAREAPLRPALQGVNDQPIDTSRHPDPKIDEPVLNVENIQGNILAGFNKDTQTMVFLRLQDKTDATIQAFRSWLSEIIPSIATTSEVLAFNRLFKQFRRRRGENNALQVTWTNIALSFEALQLLTQDKKALQANAAKFSDYAAEAGDAARLSTEAFTDAAFREGLPKRASAILGDPKDGSEGDPANWVFGGAGEEPHVVLIVAGDDPDDVSAEVRRIEDSVYSGRTVRNPAGSGPNVDGRPSDPCLKVVYKQHGATLPPPLTGHEHFGFLDGVSQPGVRGFINAAKTDLLTLRQNPTNPNQGKPGQELLWPGEFVFGYRGQTQKNTGAVTDADGPDSLLEGSNDPASPDFQKPTGPAWARDGSYFVVRRLRQDVKGFHDFIKATANNLNTSEDLLGAKLVGRWKSGAPIVRTPDQDLPALADEDCANNNFEFVEATGPIINPTPGDGRCEDKVFPTAQADPNGAVCPFAAHIRKTYPRDDVGTLSPENILEVTTQTRRLLRRGIPYGEPYFEPKDPAKNKDSGDRGLVFAAYQTSFTRQFEFIQSSWANNAEFKDESIDGVLQSGHDLIIGQNNEGPRKCVLTIAGQRHEIEAKQHWVIPTGGGYFFAPSIDALWLLSGRTPEQK